jgi:quercetin dioxygenase-like cupin family protein
MAKAGQVIEGPNGVRAEVLRTGAETDGRTFEVEFRYPPGAGNRVGAHLHTRQTESFEVLAGRVRYALDGAEREAGPGDRIVVPPGAAHVNPWAIGDEEARVRQRLEPALDFGVVLETLLGLARDGKLGPGGQVPTLALAALMDGVESKAFRPGLPVPIQAALFKLLRVIGWPLGYRARYARYSG